MTDEPNAAEVAAVEEAVELLVVTGVLLAASLELLLGLLEASLEAVLGSSGLSSMTISPGDPGESGGGLALVFS